MSKNKDKTMRDVAAGTAALSGRRASKARAKGIFALAGRPPKVCSCFLRDAHDQWYDPLLVCETVFWNSQMQCAGVSRVLTGTSKQFAVGQQTFTHTHLQTKQIIARRAFLSLSMHVVMYLHIVCMHIC